MKKQVLKIFGCILISICCSIFLLQQSAYVKKRIVGDLVTLLERTLAIKITSKNELLNFFTTSLIIEGGTITPTKQAHTTWGFEQAKISCSLWDLLFKRKISLYLSFYKVNGSTVTTTNGVEIVDHIFDLLMPKNKDFGVSIKKVLVTGGAIKVAHADQVFDVLVNGSFTFGKTMKDNHKVLQGCFLLEKSSLYLNNMALLEGVSGSNIFYKAKNEKFWHATLHNSIKKIAEDTPHHYILTGSLYKQEQTFLLQEATQQLNIKAATTAENLTLEGNIPAQTIARLYDVIKKPTAALAPNTAGQCLIDLTLSKHPTASWLCRGTIALDRPRFKDVTCENFILKNIYINQEAARADIHAIYNTAYAAQGNACWYQDKQEGSISLANSKEIIAARRPGSPVYWSIQPQQANLMLHIDKQFQVQGSYEALLHNSINEETKQVKGSIQTAGEAITLTGNAQAYSYTIKGQLGPSPYLAKVICTQANEPSPVIDFTVQDDATKTLRGYAQYSLIHQLLPVEVKNKVLGKHNKIFASLKQDKFCPLDGELWTENSKFFIPSVQNMIKTGHLQFSLNPVSKKITIQNAVIGFARGQLKIPLASCEFNPETWDIQSLYAPISVNNMLINIKRDFYSFVYGNLLLQQQAEKALNLSGTLILRKTLVHGDVFNDVQTTPTNPFEQIQELNKNFDFSIRLVNEQPIIIKTPTIDALAHVDLQAAHKHNATVAQLPHVTGTINLDTGHLKFLENNLKIEYGKIQFLTRQLDDPIIDLIAKNRINKYVVTLQVTGSLKKPTVILESTPELSEEQILGLLFTGSENASLQTDLPVMIMQNLNTILLGHRKPYDKTSLLLDTLSKPLKYVQITPDFTDQSGRSSVRALVSLPLTKQLRAQFQKNLTFDEELEVEIDYLLSDDINLKLVKDQRGELGSEVEVRFKF